MTHPRGRVVVQEYDEKTAITEAMLTLADLREIPGDPGDRLRGVSEAGQDGIVRVSVRAKSVKVKDAEVKNG